VPRGAQRRARARAARGAPRARHLLHARLDRREAPAARAAHRRRRPRAGQPRLRAPARQRARPRGLRRRRAGRAPAARGHLGHRGDRLPSAQLLDRQRQPLGLRRAGRGRLPLQLERLPDPPRPLRHARFAALRLHAAGRAGRGAGEHRAPARPQPPGQRRRLVPAAALRGDALGHRACQHARAAARGLLLPPLGDRRRPAARARHRRQDPLPALREHRPRRGPAAAPAGRLPLGPHGPHLPAAGAAAARAAAPGAAAPRREPAQAQAQAS
jgi:hypothetical protein